MTAPLRLTETPAADTPGSSVESWLGVLTGMIRAPEAERRGVRDELHSHLCDRVRDLMLAGASEADATKQAISELGDAAALARRYQEAIAPPKRRFIMQIAAVGTLSAMLSIGGVAWLGQRQPEVVTPELEAKIDTLTERATSLDLLMSRASLTEESLPLLLHRLSGEAAAGVAAHPPGLRTTEFEPPLDPAWDLAQGVTIDMTPQMTWQGLVDAVAKAGQAINVRWDRFEAAGNQPGDVLGVSGKGLTLAAVLREINERRSSSPETVIGLRQEGDAITLGVEAEFDRRERMLVAYDLSPLVAQRSEHVENVEAVNKVTEDLLEVLRGVVFPDTWVDNGGDLVESHSYGAKLFIKAPKRYHAHIRWVLGELLAQPAAEGDAASLWRRTPPILGDLPLIGHVLGGQHAERLGQGPWVMRVRDGKVEIVGENGTIIADEVRIDARGRIVADRSAGARLDLIPVLVSAGAGEGTASVTYSLSRVSADEMRDLLGRAFNIVPNLKECPVERSMAITPGDVESLVVEASAAQIPVIEALMIALDADVPEETAADEALKTIPLARLNAADVQSFLTRWFNVNPTLKHCAVGRAVFVSDATNAISIKATSRQIEAAAEVVRLLDADR